MLRKQEGGTTMKHGIKTDNELLKELIRELAEFNEHIRKGHDLRNHPGLGQLFYSFNPSSKHDGDTYTGRIRFIDNIHDVLCESRINTRAKGYVYMKDAICLINDHNSHDVCLSKEIYPYIAKKYRAGNIMRIEHSIRNAINSAYERRPASELSLNSVLDCFGRRPSVKEFLICAAHEVSCRMQKEALQP